MAPDAACVTCDAIERLSSIEKTAGEGDLPSLQAELGQFDKATAPGDSNNNCPQAERHDRLQRFFVERAIVEATKEGHTEIVVHLIERWGCVPSPGAISAALSRKNWDLAELLVRCGGDINKSVQGGNTLPVMQ